MSSYTFTLTGNSSILSCNIFPEVELDENSDYSCALLDLTTYHSIPNIVQGVNSACHFYMLTDEGRTTYSPTNGAMGYTVEQVDLPTGCYEAVEILDFIKRKIVDFGFSFEYTIDKNTSKAKIKCSTALYIGDRLSNNILKSVFGYRNDLIGIIPLNTETESTDIIKIASQDVVRVECNITSGSYVNGKSSHTIYEFATNKVDVGYKIIERPRNLIYLPVVLKRLNHIELSLVDQNGESIDFRGETVTCRIHIKKD